MDTTTSLSEVEAEPSPNAERLGRSAASGSVFRLVGHAAVLPTGLIAAGIVLFLAAPLLAGLLDAPALRPVLQIFALDTPLTLLGKAYEYALNGRRPFQRSALLPVVSGASRLLLILALVGAGMGLTGAALASLGAACAQLWFARRSLRLRLWQGESGLARAEED